MRVALLTNFVPPYRVPLFRALGARVDALRILVSTPMEPGRSWAVDWRGMDVVPQRTLTLRVRHRHPGFTEAVAVHLPYDTVAQLRRFRPDLVITAELGTRTLLALAYARTLGRCPIVVWATLSERMERGRGPGRRALRRALLRRVDGAFVNGESGARYLRALGARADTIVLLPQPIDGVPFARAAASRPPAAARRLLLVGQLTERKGIAPLVAALRRRAAARPNEPLDVRVVGDGPLRPLLQDLDAPPDLRVELRGSVPYDGLPEEYAQAGILVFPTHADEWGLVVNEALAAGVPVLGSVHAQAVQELVREGVEGWLFDPESPADFDWALARALETPAARLADMRQAARARVTALTPEATADRMVAALRQVTSARARAALVPPA